jgi:Protein of unknown function (DUF3626)
VARCASSQSISLYKEAQIHGEIRLDRDVELLLVHSKHKSDSAVEPFMAKFAEKNSCPVVFMDPDDGM